eukprot:Rmarinus@m.26569
MYGQLAAELLRDLKRSEWLPPFQEDVIRQIVTEIVELYADVRATFSNEELNRKDPRVTANVLFHHYSLLRNKRAVMAYLHYRIQRIQAIRWELGNTMPESQKERLGPTEIEFFKSYNSSLGAYMEEVNLDLTADLDPPKDLYIQVRVLESCGTIQTTSGPVTLQAGTTHFLPRSDVEHLIRSGMVAHVV